MEETQIITDEHRITKWKSMLVAFDKITKNNPTPESVKSDLEALSEAAMTTNLLTGAQKDSITARCRNYINGTYGVNKTKTEYISSNAKSS